MSQSRSVKTCAVWVHVFLYVCVQSPLVPCSSHPNTTRRIPDIPWGRNYSTLEHTPARSWHMVAKWSRQSRAQKHTQKEPWTPCTQCVRHQWECISNYTGEIKEYPHCTARKHTHTQKVELRIVPTKKLLNQNRQEKSYQMLYYVKIRIINVNPYPEWILQDITGLIWKRHPQTEKVATGMFGKLDPRLLGLM